MSTLKVIELNKQLNSRADEVAERLGSAQSDAQMQLQKLKRLEADLIKYAREMGEIKQQQALETERRLKEEAEQEAAAELKKQREELEKRDAAKAEAEAESAAVPEPEKPSVAKPEPVPEPAAEKDGEAAPKPEPVQKVAPAPAEEIKPVEPVKAEPEAIKPEPVKAEPAAIMSEPVKVQVKPEPVKQPAKEPVKEPAKEPAKEPVKEPAKEPAKKAEPLIKRSSYEPDMRIPQKIRSISPDKIARGGMRTPPGFEMVDGSRTSASYDRTGGSQTTGNYDNKRYDNNNGRGGMSTGPRGAAAGVKPAAPAPDKSGRPRTDKPKARTERSDAGKPRTIKERGFIDEERMGSRKRGGKKEKIVMVAEPIKIEAAVITTEMVPIKTLAEKTGKPAAEIIKKLFLLGVICNVNSEIDFETAELVCTDFGISLTHKLEMTAEETLTADDDQVDDEKDLVTRPPVVTIMGHVDHGKTSLLDKIRSTKVTETEAGGITQHIGAYQVKSKGKLITFLDTPGHEAFTSMRARGAQVTDITVLVVAADDGIMPQTVEAINHARAANVPIIVAINKIDRPDANPDRVMQELTEHELLPEEWGGDTVVAKVSARTGQGIDELLDMILLVAEVAELKANPDRRARGTIIEASLDKGRGPVATVLVQTGTLHVGDTIVAGTAYGKVRAMVDYTGKSVKAALPSQPVEVIGFSEVPESGDIIYAVEQDKLSRQVVEERRDRQKADMIKQISKVSLDDLFSRMAEGELKELNLIVKADVMGSVEAVTQSLEKLSGDEVKVKVIHKAVGAIKESDVIFASASNAIIIGFNVRPEPGARDAAEREKVDIRLYRIIYDAIEDIEAAMKGMLKPTFEEVVLGHAEVREIYRVSSVGTIAGSHVTDGKIVRNAKIRLLRDNIVVHEGSLSSLKRFKDDAKEVLTGYDCGITLESFNDIKEGDVIEAYEMKEVERQ